MTRRREVGLWISHGMNQRLQDQLPSFSVVRQVKGRPLPLSRKRRFGPLQMVRGESDSAYGRAKHHARALLALHARIWTIPTVGS